MNRHNVLFTRQEAYRVIDTGADFVVTDGQVVTAGVSVT